MSATSSGSPGSVPCLHFVQKLVITMQAWHRSITAEVKPRRDVSWGRQFNWLRPRQVSVEEGSWLAGYAWSGIATTVESCKSEAFPTVPLKSGMAYYFWSLDSFRHNLKTHNFANNWPTGDCLQHLWFYTVDTERSTNCNEWMNEMHTHSNTLLMIGLTLLTKRYKSTQQMMHRLITYIQRWYKQPSYTAYKNFQALIKLVHLTMHRHSQIFVVWGGSKFPGLYFSSNSKLGRAEIRGTFISPKH